MQHKVKNSTRHFIIALMVINIAYLYGINGKYVVARSSEEAATAYNAYYKDIGACVNSLEAISDCVLYQDLT